MHDFSQIWVIHLFDLIILSLLKQTTITIKNSNFFEAVLDGFSIEVNWEDYVVANPDIKETIKVSARSSHNVCYFFVTAMIFEAGFSFS